MVEKILWVATFSCIFFANACSAKTYICVINENWFQNSFNERFILIDTKGSFAKMGDNDKWGSTHKLTSKKIAIGNKYFWRQEIKAKDSNENYKVVFSLRIRSSGQKDFLMRYESTNHERWIKVDCK